MWLVAAVLVAVLVGVVGGWLSWVGGLNLANAILAGCGAFGVSLVLAITVIKFATEGRA